jgi:hypothetical protein
MVILMVMAASLLRVRVVDGQTGAFCPELFQHIQVVALEDRYPIQTGDPMHEPLLRLSERSLPDVLEIRTEVPRRLICEACLVGAPKEVWPVSSYVLVEPGQVAQFEIIIHRSWDAWFGASEGHLQKLLFESTSKIRSYGAIQGRIIPSSLPERPCFFAEVQIITAGARSVQAGLPERMVVSPQLKADADVSDWFAAPMPPGIMDVFIVERQSMLWACRVELKAGEVKDLGEIRLNPGGGTLDVYVRDTRGDPIATAVVHARPAGHPFGDTDNEGALFLSPGLDETFMSGHYRFPGIPDGTKAIFVSVIAAGYEPREVRVALSDSPVTITLAGG